MIQNEQISAMLLWLKRPQQFEILSTATSFGIFTQLSQILLDAPCNEGGMPTEVVEQAFLKAQELWKK